MKKLLISISVFLLLQFSLLQLQGQVNSFQLKTSSNVMFPFRTVNDYLIGVTVYNAIKLNVEAGTKWELQVGAITSVFNKWDNSAIYSSTGDMPDISILELRFRNGSNTSLLSGFIPLRDISNPLIVIGNGSGTSADIACPANGTNLAGSYTASPGCYSFDVDMRVIPGIYSPIYRAGSYHMTINFLLMEVL